MEKKKVKAIEIDDGFIMSPKYDFVFKYIFGNEQHKDLLIALLSDVLGLPEEEFEGIQIINSELLKEFEEDKKGILDVRVRTKAGKQIDVEIQIFPIDYMAERTLFYWSKMFTSQIKPGEPYDKLKKCVTINIVDFKCTPVNKVYSCALLKEENHLTEDGTATERGDMLTDLIEIRFLEIPKLSDKSIIKNENDRIVQWMEFLNAKSKGAMEMLVAEKNVDIKKAYDLLQVISHDEKARMLYDAKQAEISDQVTRIKSAEDKRAIKIAENLIKMGLTNEQIATAAELPVEKVLEIQKKMMH